jgi:hypothetical protein
MGRVRQHRRIRRREDHPKAGLNALRKPSRPAAIVTDGAFLAVIPGAGSRPHPQRQPHLARASDAQAARGFFDITEL